MYEGSHRRRHTRADRARRRRAARRRLALLIVVVVAAAAVAAALLHGRGAERTRGGVPAARATATGSPAPSSIASPPPKVWVASTSRPVRVWVGGDSMGGELGFSLKPLLAAAGPFKPVTFYKESSGICRYDFFDWQKQMETVSRTVKPDAAVLMMGTNDTQSVAKDGEWIPYGQVAWKRAYEERVGDIIDTLLDGGARRVYWVGMPIMGEGWRNSRMRLINRVFRKQAEKRPGAEFIDIWDLYTTTDGAFDPSLRLNDQVHFTVAGQETLAERVMEAIMDDWLPSGLPAPAASPSASPSVAAPGAQG